MFGKKHDYVPLTNYTLFDLLPHRDPFLFIDRILESSPKHVIAERAFPADSWFFKGHFPGYPIVPGVLLVETMAQCGGAGLVAAGILPKGNRFFLATIKDAKFRRPVFPNELMRIEIDVKKCSTRLVKQTGRILVNGELAVEAEWVCVVREADEIDPSPKP